MKRSSSQLSALARLFSSTVFHELAKKGRSPLFTRLLGQANIMDRRELGDTVSDAFNSAYEALRKVGSRDEYVYRAAVVEKILMGRHSLHTASMLNEFRAGACKADLVILNGTATVYEIKSERDSLYRLAKQVKNYKKVFAAVNVIASESHIEDVLATVPEEIGVMCLSRRYQISTVRKAIDRPDCICPLTVFDSLRSVEAAAILKGLGMAVPDVPNTLRHAVLRERFANLDPANLHTQMVRILKKTRRLSPLSELVRQLPESLHAAALSIPIRRSDHVRLIEAVNTPLRMAMAWS